MEGNSELLLRSGLNCYLLRIDLENRVSALRWLNSLEVEFVWIHFVIKAEVFDNTELECIIFNFVKILTIKNAPVNLNTSNTCVLDFECL